MLKKNIILLSIASLLIILPAGCRTEPVFNLKNHPIATIKGNPMKPDVIADGIIMAGNRLSWKMNRKGTNDIQAYINHDNKEAIVLISFTEKGYSVKYLNSRNFSYDGSKIHKNYNKLVISLIQGIDNELNNIANKAMFETGEIYIKTIPKIKAK